MYLFFGVGEVLSSVPVHFSILSRPRSLSRSERNSSMVLDLGGAIADVKVSGGIMNHRFSGDWSP